MQIFVSVGTHPQQFDRLLREIDKLLEMGRLKATVFAQTGNSTYEPKNYRSERFVGEKRYQKQMQNADIIVSHGGAGTIINALRLNKKLVVVPRLKRFAEHTNDHQLDLAKALEENGKCIAVFDVSLLGEKLKEVASFKPVIASNRDLLAHRIREFIEH